VKLLLHQLEAMQHEAAAAVAAAAAPALAAASAPFSASARTPLPPADDVRDEMVHALNHQVRKAPLGFCEDIHGRVAKPISFLDGALFIHTRWP